MKQEFLKTGDPLYFMRLLSKPTHKTIAEPCGLPLLGEVIPLLSDVSQWPDYQPDYSVEYSSSFHDDLRQQTKAELLRIIPEDALTRPVTISIRDSLVSPKRKIQMDYPHIDTDEVGEIKGNEFGLTFTAAYPNSTEFFPGVSASEVYNPHFHHDPALHGEIAAPRPGQAVLWNDDRHIHAAPSDELNREGWQEKMGSSPDMDKWFFKDGIYRRILCRSIFNVRSEWAMEKIREGRKLEREIARAEIFSHAP